MRTKRLLAVGGVLALAGLAARAPAADPPKGDDKGKELDSVAEKLVTQCAHVREGDLVQVSGSDKDVTLLEDVAVQVRKQGAHPLITLGTDRLARRLFDDVPAKYDSQKPEFDLKLAGLIDARIFVESNDEAALAGVPADRIDAVGQAAAGVFQTMRKRNVRLVSLGNGLYPTASRAKQFGLGEDELAKLFWDGVNVDYKQLQTTGERLKKTLSDGKEIHLTNPNGTDLKASIEKRTVFVSDGVITDEKMKQGGAACWTWLPAGEVYVAVVPGTAEGRVVVDRMFYEGKEINDLIIGVKKGKVVSLEAKANDDRLQAAYKAAGEGKDRFGVIDIGINPNVKLPAKGKVLTYMPAGMVTVNFGNDTFAGGDVSIPFGVAGFLPGSTLTVDGTAVVEKGALKN
jgi:leucyl aminopeptidase (aminopeptidase T)